MGCVYRRVRWMCNTCKKRLEKVADRAGCTTAGHVVEQRQSPVYWIKYTRAGRHYSESSESKLRRVAKSILQKREGDIVDGKPVTNKIGRVKFEDAARDLLADYTTNGKRSYDVVRRRIEKHLTPFFEGRRMANITTSDALAYTVQRQGETEMVKRSYDFTGRDGAVRRVPEHRRPMNGASSAEINRELALLKRMFTLAIRGGQLLYRPHIPMLQENNVRTGFFERGQFESVLAHLPAEIQPIIEVAYITGWRVASEVLPLEWRRVDFAGGEIRLDPGTTKNRDGRVFPLTRELRRVLEARHTEHLRLKEAGVIVPWVFFREVADGRGGDKKPRPILRFNKAWKSACKAAGCPGRIPHDLRRTAVRNLVRAGISEGVAMQMTGHKTRSVFERYNIVSEGDLRDAARRLSAPAHVDTEGRQASS
jgi:integrase